MKKLSKRVKHQTKMEKVYQALKDDLLKIQQGKEIKEETRRQQAMSQMLRRYGYGTTKTPDHPLKLKLPPKNPALGKSENQR